MSYIKIRRCHVTCRVESIDVIRGVVACTEFTSAGGRQFAVFNMTAAYNPQTHEARIYAEFDRMDEKIIEENMNTMGVRSVQIDSFSSDNWEAASEAAFRSVVECGERVGFTLIKHGNEPRAANRAGQAVGGSGDGASSGGMGGRASSDEEEEEPPPRAGQSKDERGKRKRTASPAVGGKGGMDAHAVDFMKVLFDDSKREKDQNITLRETVMKLEHEKEMTEVNRQLYKSNSEVEMVETARKKLEDDLAAMRRLKDAGDEAHTQALKTKDEGHIQALKSKDEEHTQALKTKDDAMKTKDEEHTQALKSKDDAMKSKDEEHIQALKSKDDAMKTKDEEHAQALKSKDDAMKSKDEEHIQALKSKDDAMKTKDEEHIQALAAQTLRQTQSAGGGDQSGGDAEEISKLKDTHAEEIASLKQKSSWLKDSDARTIASCKQIISLLEEADAALKQRYEDALSSKERAMLFLQGIKDRLSERHDRLSEWRVELSSRLSDVESEYADLKQEHEMLSGRLESEKKDNRERIEEFNRELNEAKAGIWPAYCARLDECHEREGQVKARNELLEAEIVVLRAGKESHDTDMKVKTDELETLEEELADRNEAYYDLLTYPEKYRGPPKVTMNFFAFAFTGPTIRRDVMANKIKKVEVGVLDGETKYCSLELFHGRLGCNLMNIVCGYNQLVDPASRISLVQLDGFPVFVCRARYFESPINRQARQDRMLKPATYATWTNPSPRRTQP